MVLLRYYIVILRDVFEPNPLSTVFVKQMHLFIFSSLTTTLDWPAENTIRQNDYYVTFDVFKHLEIF